MYIIIEDKMVNLNNCSTVEIIREVKWDDQENMELIRIQVRKSTYNFGSTENAIREEGRRIKEYIDNHKDRMYIYNIAVDGTALHDSLWTEEARAIKDIFNKITKAAVGLETHVNLNSCKPKQYRGWNR